MRYELAGVTAHVYSLEMCAGWGNTGIINPNALHLHFPGDIDEV